MPPTTEDPMPQDPPFQRTCRYGHGPLAKVNAPGSEFHGFALQGLVFTPPSPLPRVAGGGMMLDAYDCPVCGYTELVERGK